MKVGFYTLGCKLNQTETEAIADAFVSCGNEAVSLQEEADLYVINTCTVTSKSEQKARRIIRHLLETYPHAKVLVTGCYAEMEGEQLRLLGDRVIVVPGRAKDVLLDFPRRIDGTNSSLGEMIDSDACGTFPLDTERPFRFFSLGFKFHARASLKIQDGCDHRCSYCRVRLARGPSLSLPWEQVKERFLELASRGYKEIVLTGLNISQYRSEGKSLGDLLQLLLELPLDIRIRLSSLEPEGITPSVLDAVRENRVCPHFHLSVQSGSDPILQRMRRPYTTKTVQSVVEALRKVKKDPYLAADFIVGFPGETDETYQDTLRFIRANAFTDLHLFPFSPRPGTEAYELTPRVPERVTRERVEELSALSATFYRAYVERQVGEVREVLLEKHDSDGGWEGTSENYLSVHIPFSTEETASCMGGPATLVKGESVMCKILQIRDNKLIGMIV